MPPPIKKQSAWYKYLSNEESAEIRTLEKVIEGMEPALTAVRERRQVIQHRAQAREVHQRETDAEEKRALVAIRRIKFSKKWFEEGDIIYLPVRREIPLGFMVKQ